MRGMPPHAATVRGRHAVAPNCSQSIQACLCIDLCADGLAFLRERGFKDLIQWDVERLDELQVDESVEVIVAGEILEHLSNPGLFLRGILRFMKRQKSKLIISIPNAFSFRHFVPVMLKQTELVMPDHTAYYSFSTLKELLNRCDLRITESYTFCNGANNASAIRRLLRRTMNATFTRAFPQVKVRTDRCCSSE